MDIQAYLNSLALVETASLPLHAIFWADGSLYQVIEVDTGRYSRARRWGGDESSDVALVPKSPLLVRLRLVARGYWLPFLKSRESLLDGQGQALHFIFPTERTALDAANLDIALCGAACGLYVRRKSHQPAFEATNGMSIARTYYFMRTKEGLETQMVQVKARLSQTLTSHLRGPAYWRLLPTWDESPYDLNDTIAMHPVDVSNLIEYKTPPTADDEGRQKKG
jgi:hypothetical protein